MKTNDSEMKVVASFKTLGELYIFKNILDENEIFSIVQNEYSSFTLVGINEGIKLLVKECDYETALSLLNFDGDVDSIDE